MTGSVLAIILIPVVTAVAIAIWLGFVFYANRHPETGKDGGVTTDVAGGAFRGDRRQLMPRRDEPPPEAADLSASRRAAESQRDAV